MEDELRFVPHFPFAAGVKYRARFDPRALAVAPPSGVLTLEFSLPRERRAGPTEVERVFPSGDRLPENLLRFYVRFSRSMQRGRAEGQVTLLGPDGLPVSDALYRAPVELWDRSRRHLTVLLDPGRLKRGVGPNVALGPPLQAGQEYTLVIGARMVDATGHPLREEFRKRFVVAEAVRRPVAVERWQIVAPPAQTRQPLGLVFPEPLDWAMLWQAIVIESPGGLAVEGRVEVGDDETRWSFTPTLPWVEGEYRVCVASTLEDVCGNSVAAAFDQPLRADGDRARGSARRALVFHPVPEGG